MTGLARPVRRMNEPAGEVLPGERERRTYVVQLEPADGSSPAMIAVRVKGRRKWYRIGVGDLLVKLARIESEKRPRARRLRVSRGMLRSAR